MVEFFFFFFKQAIQGERIWSCGEGREYAAFWISLWLHVAKSLTMPLIANPFKEILEEICYI